MDTGTLIPQIESVKDRLTACATGGSVTDVDDRQYAIHRGILIKNVLTKDRVPKCLRSCRNLGEFWAFIKPMFGTYAERRTYIREEFDPLLTFLESVSDASPSEHRVSASLKAAPSEFVHDAWARALERLTNDPEGAITAARTLLESVCKLVLDETGTSYDERADLPVLYKQASVSINLAPSQHTEQVFKQILGGCHTVVEGLGALRNKLSDAHGRGKGSARPQARHAELAVNLAGGVATFLVATLKARRRPVVAVATAPAGVST
jgi:hypothetical protein